MARLLQGVSVLEIYAPWLFLVLVQEGISAVH